MFRTLHKLCDTLIVSGQDGILNVVSIMIMNHSGLLFLLLVLSSIAYAKPEKAHSIYQVTVTGKISNQTWFNPKSGCQKIDDTKNLLVVLKCGQPGGTETFVSPRSYCFEFNKK
jgi:hypothetical protein